MQMRLMVQLCVCCAAGMTGKPVSAWRREARWRAPPQAGTFGRFMGNMLLSAAARVTGSKTMDQIVDFSGVLFGTAAIWMALSLAFVLATYRHLVG